MKAFDIYHPWNKEVRTVEVETITAKWVSFRWPMSGVYELDLKANTIKARNPNARRKSPYCLWKAVNIENVRRAVFLYLNPKNPALQKSIAKHMDVANMPFAKAKVLSSSRP